METKENVLTEQGIKIDGEWHEVDKVHDYGYLMLEFDGMECYVFSDAEEAGEKAREYWQDMVDNDHKEFTCIVGEKALIAWCLNQHYAVGAVSVNSLEKWLDLWLDVPEEQWASYDGNEIEIEDITDDIIEELGFEPTVAYRHN